MIDWRSIEANLQALKPVEGGFTSAKRGILAMPDGNEIFVKVGIDDKTNKWSQKEISIYRSLHDYGYEHIPQLLATNDDNSGFALELLDADKGWQWETAWTEPRLSATLAAMDQLADMSPDIFDSIMLADSEEDIHVNPWHMPNVTDDTRHLLMQKLRDNDLGDLVDSLDSLQRDFRFSSSPKQLVHYDVRRDNCAWNPILGTVKLIDWNWLHIGSREIDVNALLVNVYKSGLDIAPHFSQRLDKPALLWLCGYWLNSSMQPGESTMSDSTSLRSYQFDSAVAAYKLAAQII